MRLNDLTVLNGKDFSQLAAITDDDFAEKVRFEMSSEVDGKCCRAGYKHFQDVVKVLVANRGNITIFHWCSSITMISHITESDLETLRGLNALSHESRGNTWHTETPLETLLRMTKVRFS